MAVGSNREAFWTNPYLDPFENHPSVATKLKTKDSNLTNAKDGKKLTDLMQRLQTINGLYDSKKNSEIYTGQTATGTEPKHPKLRAVMMEKLSKNRPVRDKPNPVATLNRQNKRIVRKLENVETFLSKRKEKSESDIFPKLHAGKGVGISAFKLKDSRADDKVIQSVAQDDLPDSFQSLSLSRSETGLYHDALASSHKYNMVSAKNEVGKRQSVKDDSDRPVPTTGGSRDERVNFDNTMRSLNAMQKKSKLYNLSGSVNGLLDFGHTIKSHGNGDVLAHRNSRVYPKEIPMKPERVFLKESNAIGRNKGRLEESKLSDQKFSQPGRYVPTATLVDMSEQGVRHSNIVDIDERLESEWYKKRESDLANNFGRATGENSSSDENVQLKSQMIVFSSILDDESPTSMHETAKIGGANTGYTPGLRDASANGYYLSTYLTQEASTPTSSLSPGPCSSRHSYSKEIREALKRASHCSHKDCTVPPPPTPKTSSVSSCSPTPASANGRKLFGNLQKVSLRTDFIKSKERTIDSRIPRKVLGLKHRRIAKDILAKDPNLDTIVQGFACASNSYVSGSPSIELQTSEKTEDKKQDSLFLEENSEDDKSNGCNGEKISLPDSHFTKSKQSGEGEYDVLESAKARRLTKTTGKLAPLMKPGKVLYKTKFVLSREEEAENSCKESIQLSSEPIVFTVRHPVYSSYSKNERTDDQHEPGTGEKDFSQKTEQDNKKSIKAMPNGFHIPTGDHNQTVVVLFRSLRDETGKDPNANYGIAYKNSFKVKNSSKLLPNAKNGHQDQDLGQTNTKPGFRSSYLPSKSFDLTDLRSGTEVFADRSDGKTDVSEGTSLVGDVCNEKVDRCRFRATMKIRNASKSQFVNLKMAAGGGFKSNVAHYSMLFRQQQQLREEQENFIRMMKEQHLERRKCDSKYHVSPRDGSSYLYNLSGVDLALGVYKSKTTKGERQTLETEVDRLESSGKNIVKLKNYKIFSSSYPPMQEHVRKQNRDPARKKSLSSVKTHYVWPEEKKKKLSALSRDVSTVKSRSVSSDAGSVFSLNVADINFASNAQSRINVSPLLRRASIPSKIHEAIALSDEYVLKQLDTQYMMFPLPDILANSHAYVMNENRIEEAEEINEVEVADALEREKFDSAAILPDPGTTSYRLTHDVSFDEGSRYGTMGHNGEIHMMKGKEDSRAHLGSNNISFKYEGKNTSIHHLNNSNNNNVALKEAVPLSLIRLEERTDLPLAASPSSPVMSSAIAASTASSFIPPSSGSRSQQQNQNGTLASGNTIATFRFHKEKQNWNYRLGDLSINGGGYYTSNSMPSMAKQDSNSVGTLNISQMNNTVNLRNTQTRERTTTTAKSRLSSRFSYKAENSNGTLGSKEYLFQDPCIGAPPSFQQRLTDLSLLESETIKYERNRKLRRKKNQDKDS